MSKFYLEHMNSIFEFDEVIRFDPHPDGGMFVSVSSGKQVFSTDCRGHSNPTKLQDLRDAENELASSGKGTRHPGP